VKSWSEMAGVANRAGEWKIFKSIIFNREVDWAMTRPRILSPSVSRAIIKFIDKFAHSTAPSKEGCKPLPKAVFNQARTRSVRSIDHLPRSVLSRIATIQPVM
jgi:hypothetical protein